MESTEECVRRAQEGDDVAFTRLVRDVYPQLYRWALVQTGSADDAEDVVQSALIRMHRHLPGFRHDARLTTWLYAIVRRASADWRRASRRRQVRERHYEVEAPEYTGSPARQLDAERARTVLHAALRALPVRQREVFDMAELQGMPATEVAELLALSPNTVRVHLLRARRAMRAGVLARHPHVLEELS